MNTSPWFVNNFEYFEFECLKASIRDVIDCCHEHKYWTNYKRMAYSFERVQEIFAEKTTPLDATVYGFTPDKYPNISVFLHPNNNGLAVPGFFAYKSGNELYRIRGTTPSYPHNNGGYIQEVYVEKKLDAARLIRVMDDGRLIFYETGLPFSFEDQSFYKKRKVIDRFSMETALKYMECLGFPLCDEDLWINHGDIYVWHYS